MCPYRPGAWVVETDTGIAPFSVVGKGWIANKSGKLVITEKSEKNQQQITMYVTQCTHVLPLCIVATERVTIWVVGCLSSTLPS
jgi:hypothetical protein